MPILNIRCVAENIRWEMYFVKCMLILCPILGKFFPIEDEMC